METVKAESIKKEILDICSKHGLWCTVEQDLKPGLKMIRIKEISIKVDK